MKFNLSYSSLSLYRDSPRTFYYAYIKKLPKPDNTIEVYGKSGNVVHEHIENYIHNNGNKENIPSLESVWVARGLDTEPGFNGVPLSLPIYKKCATLGMQKIDIYKKLKYKLTPEKKFQFEYEPGINIKGFVDVEAVKEDRVVLLDWKTNNSYKKGEHKEQRLFYSWLYWKQYGIIPNKCIWYYLKVEKEDSDSFTLKQILKFEEEMHAMIEEIKSKGYDEENYEIGDVSSPFNGYKSLMIDGVEDDLEPMIEEKVTIKIQNAKLIIENLSDSIIEELRDDFKYELKNAFFIKRAMGKKGVKFDGYKNFLKVKND